MNKGKRHQTRKTLPQKNIIDRIESDKFLLDFRSILPSSESEIIQVIKDMPCNI